MLEKSVTKSAKCSGGGPFLCSTHSAGLCAFEPSGALSRSLASKGFRSLCRGIGKPKVVRQTLSFSPTIKCPFLFSP
jgi:hypothetical protein